MAANDDEECVSNSIPVHKGKGRQPQLTGNCSQNPQDSRVKERKRDFQLTPIKALLSRSGRRRDQLDSELPAVPGQSTDCASTGSTTNPSASHPDVEGESNKALTPSRTTATPIKTIDGMHIFNVEVEESLTKQFRHIQECLEGVVVEHLSRKRVEFRPLGMQLMVLGTDEAHAKPYIVFICPGKVQSKLKSFLQKDYIRRIYEGPDTRQVKFGTAVLGRPLRPSASEELDAVFITKDDIDCWDLVRPQIKVMQLDQAQYATMGGFVCVSGSDDEKVVYGLTVGHVLSVAEFSDEENPTSDSGIEESCDSLNPGCDEVLSIYSEFSDLYENEAGEAGDDGIDVSAGSGDDGSWFCIGNMSEASYSASARDRDWAVVKLDEKATAHLPSHYLPNLPYFKSCQPHGGQAIVVGNRNKTTSCTISELSARALLPSGRKFVDVYILQLADNEALPKGSSGSWVLEFSINGSMPTCGMVVAADPFGCYWMVPMTEILEDIRRECNALDVQLLRFDGVKYSSSAGQKQEASTKTYNSPRSTSTAESQPTANTESINSGEIR
ncbi:hypothetical protein FB567DRAFT_628589 [Paraphoma chrysanthemicola]|uniref:Uncharacterized protein n=1 Tax=Paraphoma chrysanthemicola TaxID=798071 RepID=A0A8K0R5Z2_9PLEO|nr:hypothetical protein FB567DRAFT_628589 [Paraphoma chrysanthemicola]